MLSAAADKVAQDPQVQAAAAAAVQAAAAASGAYWPQVLTVRPLRAPVPAEHLHQHMPESSSCACQLSLC